jgi:hypothetical protein
VQLYEGTTICHFIKGIQTNLNNEFPLTQVGPFVMFMKWQHKNNPQFVAQDKDLQRAIVKLEAKEARGQTT